MTRPASQREGRGFAETNLYLVPASPSQALQPRLASQRVTAYLDFRRIIGGVYDSDLGWLSAGERARDLFAGSAKGAGFEYLIVYEHAVAQFVPNAHTGSFGVRCTRCGAELDDALRGLLRNQSPQCDCRSQRLQCEACGRTHPLGTLHCSVDMALTCFYLNFCNVGSVELAADVLSELESRVGAPLRLLVERL